MGLQTGIHVWGFLKPTLTVELVEGGSLLPNTKYYVAGIMRFAGITYNAISSPMSDVYEITTTTTALSIKITQKTYRDITAFADNGDGRTLVTCPRHCMLDGVFPDNDGTAYSIQDTFKIDSGSYTGTHLVDEWVDYNTFVIDTPYIDNVPVQCYTDTPKYNAPTSVPGHSYLTRMGMSYYIYITDPIDPTDGHWTGASNRWSDSAYTNNYIYDNPVTIPAAVTNTLYGGNIQVLNIDYGLLNNLTDGIVWVLTYDTDHTLNVIHNEVQNSGFVDNSYHSFYAGYSNAETFGLAGTIFNVSGNITGDQYNIRMIGGEMYTSENGSISLKKSMLHIDPPLFSAYYIVDLEGGVVYSNAQTNSVIGWFYGNNVTISVIIRLNFYADITGLFYTNEFTGVDYEYAVGENKIFKVNRDNQIMQIAYDSFIFKNCTVNPLYWVLQKNVLGNKPSIYMLENCFFSDVYSDSNPYHFRCYSYNPIGVYYEYKLLNVDTAVTDNVKRMVHNSTMNAIFRYYRRIEFYIGVSGAALSIIDGDGNEYSGTTDINGYGYVDCVEQLTEFLDSYPATYDWNPNYDTLYSDFIFTISKDGYYTLILEYSTLFGNEVVKGGLIEIPTDPEADGLTTAYQSESMRHLFLNEAVPDIGDVGGLQPSVVDGDFFIALFTGDPGESGSIVNEATFTGYSRIPVPRGSVGWNEYLGKINNLNSIQYQENTGGENIITHYAIMKDLTGTDMIARGTLSEESNIIPGQRFQFGPMALEFKID